MNRIVSVKNDLMEVGIGSVPAALKWESDPTEDGAFAHLAVTDDGRYVLSITDMEEYDGAYTSVAVTFDDLVRLHNTIPGIWAGQPGSGIDACPAEAHKPRRHEGGIAMALGHGREYALRLLRAVMDMPEMPTFTHATQVTQKALGIAAKFPAQWVPNYAIWCECEGWLRVNRGTSPHTYSITAAGWAAIEEKPG